MIWEVHPDRERYTCDQFEILFRSAIESEAAFAILDLRSGPIIGSSRFVNHDAVQSCVEIGYTFLTREYWGGKHNREMKSLMMNYAFQFVEVIHFVVGRNNPRSRKAMTKLGGIGLADSSHVPATCDISASIVYRISKQDWLKRDLAIPFDEPGLNTARLFLEPVTETHAEELWELSRDPALHHFVPFEPQSLERQRERCSKWAKRRVKSSALSSRGKTRRSRIDWLCVVARSEGVDRYSKSSFRE